MADGSTSLFCVLRAAHSAIAVGARIFVSKVLARKGSKLYAFMRKNHGTNAQTGVRFVMVLLVGLVALSAVLT